LSLLPQEPRQQVALIAMTLAVGGLLAFHASWHGPRADAVRRMEARVESLDAGTRQAQVQAERGNSALEGRTALYERHILELERLIPRSEEVPQLLRAIHEEARRAGVTLNEMAPDADQPGSHYVKQGWSLRLMGEYDDVGRFMTAIASLPRIVTPVAVEVSTYVPPPGLGLDYPNPVAASFRIETYVLPESPAGPHPGALGPEGLVP